MNGPRQPFVVACFCVKWQKRNKKRESGTGDLFPRTQQRARGGLRLGNETREQETNAKLHQTEQTTTFYHIPRLSKWSGAGNALKIDRVTTGERNM